MMRRTLVGIVILTTLLGLSAALLWRYRILRMPASSMQPLVPAGSRILAKTLFPWERSRLRHGDVIFFLWPSDPSRVLLKRVVGLPGDHVTVLRTSVRVNDTPLDEPYAVYLGDPNSAETPMGSLVGEFNVPSDSFFVLGDNRDRSFDSRFWGCVPASNVKGRMLHVFKK